MAKGPGSIASSCPGKASLVAGRSAVQRATGSGKGTKKGRNTGKTVHAASSDAKIRQALASNPLPTQELRILPVTTNCGDCKEKFESVF